MVPSQGGLTSPSILYFASSCPSTLAVFILSLFSPLHGDTKRHLPGRDKPILVMARGEPDATRLSCPPLSLSCAFLPGRTVLRRASSTISAALVCVFLCQCVFVFLWLCGCMCVLKKFKGFPLFSSSVNRIHGRQRGAGGTARDSFRASPSLSRCYSLNLQEEEVPCR